MASDALWRLAGENGLSDARFAAVVSTYRAAEHLYDLAEALAGGLPLDHQDVVLSLRGALWRLAEMEGAHGIDVLPGQDKVQMVGASGGPSPAGYAATRRASRNTHEVGTRICAFSASLAAL